MLDAADILINVHPIIHAFIVKCAILPRFFIARVSGEIPTALKKRIHRIGFADSFAAAFRALYVLPALVFIKRISFAGYLHVVR